MPKLVIPDKLKISQKADLELLISIHELIARGEEGSPDKYPALLALGLAETRTQHIGWKEKEIVDLAKALEKATEANDRYNLLHKISEKSYALRKNWEEGAGSAVRTFPTDAGRKFYENVEVVIGE